ncbi:alpha-1,2 glucosyltransferas-like protein alg10 [Byssothecium circinans]|uniref:Dol-P-Glc:Glc(2)Man(9)GlcNAc(2)-PP-Dol alpha-1,2-glucosyltransferase n=1 Tax=Byssothecium circinans TaxID=147558 RepID=A0A6A5U6C3_9PLEO|nr:alpha-1,2 glucosyltransferas-like protein alg10 [Byssothecium circinans]
MPSLFQLWALPGALLAIANISVTWYNLVSENVPEPYLDEAFHVPQAQRYCNNDYTWDPKITTPPGLYLASLLIDGVAGCETSTLRSLNAGAICLICLVSYNLLRSVRKGSSNQTKDVQYGQANPLSLLDAHSALNISLFPPMFFFSALYYTDVMSTLVVLISYSTFLGRKDTTNPFFHNMVFVVIGIIALLFRQTNIFWVAVFPAALAVVDALKENGGISPAGHHLKTILKMGWSDGKVYDCCVESAGPQDFLIFFASLALAAIKRPFLIVKSVSPYLVLLALFVGFVVWNGSVVLGDKSAHTATLHLPQMLYFWPYVVFFSVPLTIGSVLSPFVGLLPTGPRTVIEDHITGKAKVLFPSFISATLFMVSGLTAVHYNTIIHPYTLADNRHYVFYVFRILRRHPTINYAAVPLYYICAWMTFQTLGEKTPGEDPAKQTSQEKRSVDNNTPSQPCQISFVVAWVATATLSVATAPLVEPRYFIIPWIMWRLHVPYLPGPREEQASGKRRLYDMRLVLETVWLLTINAVLGYNFLYRGFSWPQEPGKVQRFLW